ncbi:unnamed protein product [Gongylonema pulchrum]|uniref:Rho-GAP domain-containing protein n=1 Tax=Gongylonema pulchrum TaxID=637853 RepID=A0A183EXC8_9BILA|nr:unnamed protein product [Gongylonema pulchrum]
MEMSPQNALLVFIHLLDRTENIKGTCLGLVINIPVQADKAIIFPEEHGKDLMMVMLLKILAFKKAAVVSRRIINLSHPRYPSDSLPG